MRYFAFDLEKGISYNSSGKSLNSKPLKHIKRKLSNFELFFVTDGVLKIEQNEEFSVKKGEILLQNKGEWQSGTKASPCTFYWFHFNAEAETRESEEEIKKVCERGGKWIFFSEYFAPPNMERILPILSELNHRCFESGGTIVKNALTEALVAELAEQYGQTHAVYTEDKRFAEILGWLKVNFTKDFSFSELAEKFSYNPKYLSCLFHKVTGMTAKAYVTGKRLDVAKKMLILTNEPIKKIAWEVGYSDEYYFMRVFKKEEGMTPKGYRKAFCGCYYT